MSSFKKPRLHRHGWKEEEKKNGEKRNGSLAPLHHNTQRMTCSISTEEESREREREKEARRDYSRTRPLRKFAARAGFFFETRDYPFWPRFAWSERNIDMRVAGQSFVFFRPTIRYETAISGAKKKNIFHGPWLISPSPSARKTREYKSPGCPFL